jgi:hypothetical protein
MGMSIDCAACRSAEDLFLPVPVVPSTWRPIAGAGVPVAPWVPADASRTRVLFCTVCGTRWCAFHEDRDGNYVSAATSFPPDADAVMQADAPAAAVATARLVHPGSAPVASLGIEHAPAPGTTVVAAIGIAPRSATRAYDVGRCLRWLFPAITKHPAAARVLTEAPAVLLQLHALPDRASPKAEPPGMLSSAIATLAASIGAAIERLAPARMA